jgi:hypothetical protein
MTVHVSRNALSLTRWSYFLIWGTVFLIGMFSGHFETTVEVFGSLGIILLVLRQAFRSSWSYAQHLSSAIIALMAGTGSILALLAVVELFQGPITLDVDLLALPIMSAAIIWPNLGKGLAVARRVWPHCRKVKTLSSGSVVVALNCCVALFCVDLEPSRTIDVDGFWALLALLWSFLGTFWFAGAWLAAIEAIESGTPPLLPPMRTVGATLEH